MKIEAVLSKLVCENDLRIDAEPGFEHLYFNKRNGLLNNVDLRILSKNGFHLRYKKECIYFSRLVDNVAKPTDLPF
ncbi:MAG: hypothetical protein K9I36_16705 [Bacteroidia bacterium]|nr:hypothetical protein [Bacteroidia bacterium]